MAFRLNVVLFRIETSISNVPQQRPRAFVNWFVNRNFWANPPFAKHRECGVDTDSREPCLKAGSSVEISEMDEGVKNRVLESILGIFSIVCNPEECEENAPGMSVAEFNECPFVPGLRLRKKHFFPRGGFQRLGY